MKSRGAYLTGILIISIVSAGIFGACDKNTDSKVKVTAVNKLNKEPIADANVTIEHQGGTIGATGRTNENGEFSATFSAPAVFDVRVDYPIYAKQYDTIYEGDTYRVEESEVYAGVVSGNTQVKLKDGEEVSVTVLLNFSNIR